MIFPCIPSPQPQLSFRYTLYVVIRMCYTALLSAFLAIICLKFSPNYSSGGAYLKLLGGFMILGILETIPILMAGLH